MPKRDDDYMLTQRETIAKAALTVLLEKGIYDTSLRDICRAAGVSNGALYTHFETKEAVIVAACVIDHVQQQESALPATWTSYLETFFDTDHDRGSYKTRRFRLSLQFVAELSQMDRNPEGLTAIYHIYSDNVRRTLARFKDRGIITLPFDLDLTTQMHLQIFGGAEYQHASNRDLPVEEITGAMRQALAVTAGLIETPEA